MTLEFITNFNLDAQSKLPNMPSEDKPMFCKLHSLWKNPRDKLKMSERRWFLVKHPWNEISYLATNVACNRDGVLMEIPLATLPKHYRCTCLVITHEQFKSLQEVK